MAQSPPAQQQYRPDRVPPRTNLTTTRRGPTRRDRQSQHKRRNGRGHAARTRATPHGLSSGGVLRRLLSLIRAAVPSRYGLAKNHSMLLLEFADRRSRLGYDV